MRLVSLMGLAQSSRHLHYWISRDDLPGAPGLERENLFVFYLFISLAFSPESARYWVWKEHLHFATKSTALQSCAAFLVSRGVNRFGSTTLSSESEWQTLTNVCIHTLGRRWLFQYRFFFLWVLTVSEFFIERSRQWWGSIHDIVWSESLCHSSSQASTLPRVPGSDPCVDFSREYTDLAGV